MRLAAGSAPKDPAQRARRNRPATSGIKLPAGGRDGDPPPWPLTKGRGGAATAEARVWRELWATPQAAAWERLGPGTARVVARYVRLCTAATVDPRVASEVRQLEDRLGLNPLSMRRLGWEVADDELAAQRAVEQAPADPSRSRQRYAELRAVGDRA